MIRKLVLLLFSLLLLEIACQQQPDTLFSRVPSSKSGVKFKNILRETEEFNVLNYGYFYNGGGVAIGDINNDGLPDIYFTGNLVASKLYLNKGDMQFEEIAETAGVRAEGLWNTGVTMADVNGDGYLDIYVCRSAAANMLNRTNLLFINNKDLTFTEQAKDYGIDDWSYSTQATFFDYDLDGDLDLYLLNHSVQEFAGFSKTLSAYKNRSNPVFGDKLYRNDGPLNPKDFSGGFTDVTRHTGLKTNVLGFGLGVAVSDVNGDNWPDIYVSNDYNEQDYLYINQQNGSFKESLAESINHVSMFSMGNDIGDINNDGLPDILTLDMLPEDHYRQKMTSGPDHYEKNQILKQNGFYHQTMRNMLQLNNGNGTFSEIGQLAGISNTDWSWAGLIADYDNDGYNDIYISNGYMRDYTNMDFMSYSMNEQMKNQQTGTEPAMMELLERMPAIETADYIYKNTGGLTFENMTSAWGLDKLSMTNGAAYADLDNDGDLDIVANHVNEIASIYENHSEDFSDNHYIKIKLKGKALNIHGIGAKVWVKTASNLYFRELYHSRGFQSAVEPIIHVGLGKDSIIQEVKIQWPASGSQVLKEVEADQLLLVEESGQKLTDESVDKTYFAFDHEATPGFVHQENQFVDFKSQPLLPRMLSTQGPKLAVGDVNQDGWEDVFIGGANGQAGELWLQQASGKWISSKSQPWETDAASEDLGSIFFDADGDGDLDLYVCSGGNELAPEDPAMQDRLYLNENGWFRKAANHLPTMPTSTMAVAAFDLENDGDLDLFVGGRLVPGKYPEVPSSYVLLNDGAGNFSDVTDNVAPDLRNIGHVCDAITIEGEGQHILAIVGEWMPIVMVKRAEENRLQIDLTAFDDSSTFGWWNAIQQNDFDGDGDMDFVVGNQGMNEQFQARADQPVFLYAKDFDSNGSLDPIMTYFIQGNTYPMASRDEILGQLVHLRKKYPSYESYANQQVKDIFSETELDALQTLNATEFSTVYLENLGTGKYQVKALPIEAQFAPVFAIESLDINDDSNPDLILAGNFSGTRVKFGESDANFGQLFLGDGKGDFQYISQFHSGLNLRGDFRDACKVKTPKGNFLFFAQSNGPILGFRVNP